MNTVLKEEQIRDTVAADPEKEELVKGKGLYSAIWRWYFYAGIIFAP